ncbi:MAG: C69 family dipeptidase [Muribaculaceae bacterium]|nr:C69 family dipeptidase [Muribaculaceae bacterium]
MLKRLSIVTSIALSATVSALACTSLIAGKGATADGSVMITYAADSHNLYGELYSQPAADHPDGSMRRVVDWDSQKVLGYIPEVSHTYATIGNMNEHGLAIAESTWGGHEELEGSGLIDYGSLIYITLQRARTAREAIKVMTDLVKDYGYASSGESFSIADPNEVWIMELIGKGKDDPGAVWVAMRVPDDCISGHANHSRIHTFPVEPTDECLFSPDVREFARAKGYYDGSDADFSFSRAFADYDFGALRGCDARVWSYYNANADGMDRYLTWINEADGEVMPLWVKPNHKLTAGDMKQMMRDHFEGTPFDMTKDVGAGPYAVPYRWRPMSFEVDGKEYTHERAIATQQTGFSFVARLRNDMPDHLKGLLWFGTDDANTCVYMPIYCGVREVPASLGHGDTNTLDWDANFWVNNYVANQAYNRYSQMIPDIRRVQGGLEKSMVEAADNFEQRAATMTDAERLAMAQNLADYWSDRATKEYKQLGDYLFVKFMDGNIKKQNDDGSFKRTDEGIPAYPSFGGYDDPRYFENIVRETGDHFMVKPIKK